MKIRWWEEQRGGDYSRDAIILNISVQGRRLIEGRLLFEEMRYLRDQFHIYLGKASGAQVHFLF